jgi:glycine/D-amino acid oxidase-like deaminating enzyme
MKKRKKPAAPVSKEYPPSDVVVIGGGIVGMSCAWQLAKEGLKVTLLDRGLCGQEASWAGAGVLQCGSWHRHDPLVTLLRESLKRYDAFAAELRERTKIDPEFIHCGSFELLFEDQQYRMAASEVRAAESHRETYGRPVLELLPPEEPARSSRASMPSYSASKPTPSRARSAIRYSWPRPRRPVCSTV